MGTAITSAEVPDFTVIAVCNLDLVFAEQGRIKSPFPEGRKR